MQSHMAMAYGMQDTWLKRNVGYLVVGGLSAVFGGFVLYPYLKSQGLMARQAADVRVGRPAYVTEAAGPIGRDLGYTGYPIGPRGNYPGAKGPSPAVPVYGSYLAFGDEQGPPFGGVTQGIETRQPQLGLRGTAAAAIEEHHTYAPHDPVDLGATRPVDNGVIDAGVVTHPPLAVVPYTQQFPSPGRGYLAFGNEQGPAPGPRYAVQSVATAQEAWAEEGEVAFPGWHPGGSTGPLGAFHAGRLTLSDDGGGYVNPTAYAISADGTWRPARHSYRGRHSREAFYPVETSTVAPGFSTIYRNLSLANTIDIQTDDYPGGEVGFNLAVGNLPDLANGNLNAPVTRQFLAPPGGIQEGESGPLVAVGHPYLRQSG